MNSCRLHEFSGREENFICDVINAEIMCVKKFSVVREEDFNTVALPPSPPPPPTPPISAAVFVPSISTV